MNRRINASPQFADGKESNARSQQRREKDNSLEKIETLSFVNESDQSLGCEERQRTEHK
jgi:hypothetical protein